MTVYFDKARNAWTAEVIVAGKRLRRRAASQEEARAAEAELRGNREAPQTVGAVPSSSPSKAPVFDPNLPHTYAIRHIVRAHAGRIWSVRAGGATDHAETAQKLAVIMDDLLDGRPLASLTASDIHDLVDSLIEERDIAAPTVNRYLACLRRIYAVALEHGYAHRVPPLPYRHEYAVRERVLSHAEEARLFAALRRISPLAAECATVFLRTGARPKEIFTARREWLRPGMLEVPGEHSKTHRRRPIALTPEVEAILSQRLEAIVAFGYRAYRAAWNKARQEVGLAADPQFTPYCLRHTWATRAIDAGVDLRIVKEVLGHSNINTTLRYTHTQDNHLAAAVMAVAGVK